MTKVSWRFERFHVIRQRAASGRSDSVFLTVVAKNSDGTQSQLPRPGEQPLHIGFAIKSGATIQLGERFTIGPFEILPESNFMITVVAVNLGDFEAPGDAIVAAGRITNDVAKFIFELGTPITPIPVVGILGGIAMVVGTIVAGIAWIVETIGDLFSPPKCNGEVYTSVQTYAGDRLLEVLSHGSLVATDRSRPIKGGDDCGGDPNYSLVKTVFLELTPTPGHGPGVARRDGHLDLFWIGDEGLMHTWWDSGFDNARWQAPFSLAPRGHTQPGAVSAISRRPEHLDVFWIGRRLELNHMWWDSGANEGRWSSLFPLAEDGSAAPGAISAVSRHPERLDVFYIGTGGNIMSTIWDNRDPETFVWDGGRDQLWDDLVIDKRGRWWEPFPITPPGSAQPGAISAVARTLMHLDVFWIGPGGEVMSAWWDSREKGWSSHFWIAPPGSAQPGAVAAVARHTEHLDVFWIGPQGEVMSTWWDSGANDGQWFTPFPIAPSGSAAPDALTAVARHREHLDVFWIGPDGQVKSVAWDSGENDGRWGTTFDAAPPGSAQPGAVSVAAQHPEHLDLFWIGLQGQVITAWWDSGANNGRWNTPFPLSPPNSARPGW